MATQKFLYVINHLDFTHTLKKVDPGNSPKTNIIGFLKDFLEKNPQYLRVSVEDKDGFGLEFRLFTEAEAQALANQLADAADASGNSVTAVTDFTVLDTVYKNRLNQRVP